MECTATSASSAKAATTPLAELSHTSWQYSKGAVRTSFPLRTAFLKLDIQRGETSCGRQKKGRVSSFVVRASINGEESTIPIAPFQPESPTGQYLTQLLQSHPHLVPAAIEQELEKLAENRNAQDASVEPNPAGSELVLYRRIAELKEQETQRALEEIIYTLIVQKFVEAGISMVPNLISISSIEKPWQTQVKELESVHSQEVLELVADHMVLVLGGQGGTEYVERNTFAQISKLRVGQVYAASIIYGYFLRRIYQRYQLEKSMKMLPPGLDKVISEEDMIVREEEAETANNRQQQVAAAAAMAALQGLTGDIRGPEPIRGSKVTKLQSFIRSIDVEMLQKMATVRSRESLRVLEKHTEALFGRPEIMLAPDGSMRVNKDEVLKMSLAGLKHLVLEAIAFGSFLWDVEGYVDATYAFV